MRTGGQVLADALVAHGSDLAFCVPGESYLGLLDGLYEHRGAFRIVNCRHEGAAANAADAYGKLTGRPGLCFVTRGPGATHAATGIHTARQDSTPLIMFVGQVPRESREREAFQEIDFRAVFGSLTKWATEIDDAARIPEIVSRAFHTATSGRPGPVVVALPEDMLTDRVIVADAPPFEPVETWPGLSDMARLQKLLWAAEQPIMLIGGSRWSEAAWASVARFAERLALPVATTFRRGHLFDALHPCYAGDLGIGPNPKLLARIRAADLVIVVGTRLGEMPSQGYTLFDIPGPRQTFVHVHPGAEELGRVYRPHLAINAAPTAFAAALEGVQPPNEIRWRDGTRIAHEDYLAWTQTPGPQPGAVNFGEIMLWLREHLPADAILCSGAGNFAAWIHRYYRFRRFVTHIGPTAGSMGYGVPAAVAMKRLNPQRSVVCIAGDGDFLMNGQEFATAVQYGLPFVVVLLDNGIYGTIRMHQEREYPGRVIATELKNPDFAAYARAFGGFGITVEKTDDFAVAYAAAVESGKPAIVHLRVDPEAVTPTMSLSAIREKALATKGP
ncbi:MAG: thiamine pyrophosphate-binding protein [Xanthobacteraceae bacterium]